MMVAPPTFLQIYLRRCEPGQLGSLRIVLTAAEKLPERLRLDFEARFGIRPIEGYGATECSPAVATSVPDVRYEGIYQAGSRPGSVGRPLPGVLLRIVHPETNEEQPAGEEGLILVRGPNVMQGYLGRDDLTREAIRDGWYVTGDVGRIDEEGFLYITGRLARFSKIGGEMVPHGRVEEALHEVSQRTELAFAVTALPDEKKGEQLAVVHVVPEEEAAALPEKLARLGLPNLFIPRPERFVRVDALPLLGSGKLDLQKVKELAAERLAHDRHTAERP
jgi:acyl-[acyl-carrier-protein]-phospholipid O-acyltransferase/long-chain-fatty-acid--[acyl-carrier-protein] ligase